MSGIHVTLVDAVFQFVDADAGVEGAGFVLITDRVMQRYDGTDVVRFAGETIVPPGVEETSAEARDVEVSGVEDRFLVRRVVGVGLENDHAGERTVFGVALGRELNLTTGYSIPAQSRWWRRQRFRRR